jgi:hypothetical protein
MADAAGELLDDDVLRARVGQVDLFDDHRLAMLDVDGGASLHGELLPGTCTAAPV